MKVAIKTREHLIHVLTEAAEIEHNLLCSYLYATFSLKRADEGGLTERQGEAVERWRKLILKVALEEMGHLACVNNLLIAIGGAPHLDRPNLPVAPGYHPAGIVVRLTPFDAATLDHFIFLERPTSAPIADADGFEAVGEARVAPAARLAPSSPDYGTVGALYESLAAGFTAVAARLGEGALIHPAGAGQLDSGEVGLPNVPRITDLASALSVIAQIKEEGEGSSGLVEQSHFDRFVAIRDEWHALAAEDPNFTPAWPAASDPVMRKPIEGADRVWITAQPAAALLDLGNALYGAMLQMLAQAFGGEDAAGPALMKASVEMMEACAAVAVDLARLPASDDHPGVNAGLTFAVPRNVGRRMRGVEGFAERVAELRNGARAVTSGACAEKVERRLGNALKTLNEG